MEYIRPWGSYIVYFEEEKFLIKMLIFKPHSQTSLQIHKHRDEHWIVVQGEPYVMYNGTEHQLKVGNYMYIENNKAHRIINDTDDVIRILELQMGNPDEADIIRIEDIYGRIDGQNLMS